MNTKSMCLFMTVQKINGFNAAFSMKTSLTLSEKGVENLMTKTWLLFVCYPVNTNMLAIMSLHWSNIKFCTFFPFLFPWVFYFCLLFHLLSPCKGYFLWVNFRLGFNEFNNCGKFFSFPLRKCNDIIYCHINYPKPFQKSSGLTWSKGLQSFLQSSS